MDAINEMLKLNFSSTLLSVFIVLTGFKSILTLLEWTVQKTGIEFKWVQKKNNERTLLEKTAKRITALEEQREIDVRESIKHDKAIREDLIKVSDTVDSISSKLDDMKIKNDASERAKLKDLIAQSYRKYSEKKKWSRMEQEAFRGLIMDYELHGGNNSFVHQICEPESYTWTIID
ncbi:hypothetical protein LJC58_03860 [Lachnospiraceae bacterium OttesenSCG-928-D06]|nr:hypothetical protein [Lachnospiraceae bacterium OttesenSCG-928-D06]